MGHIRGCLDLGKPINIGRLFLAFARLRSVLREIEHDLEISKFSSVELDVLSVIVLLCAEKNECASAEILEHPQLREAARATVYRAISSLEDRGYLVSEKRRSIYTYSLNTDVM